MVCEIRSFIGTRSVQEDHAAFCENEKGLFAVVCDGIGSRADGGSSSRLAADRFIELFCNEYIKNFPAFITDAAERIDAEVFENFGKNSGTAAVAAFITGNKLYWLSVGDCRIYIIRSGRIKQITTDHTYKYVLDLRRKNGIIDEHAYNREIEKGGHLASFIGMGGIDIVDVSLAPLKLKSGDKILLVTDGLYKTLTEKSVYDIISSDKSAEIIADKLIDAVKRAEGSIDNTTLALIYFDVTEGKT